jgi:biotin carboxyl carrier protein
MPSTQALDGSVPLKHGGSVRYPKLRREILLHKRVEGRAQYFDLKLPTSHSICSLYDFELILAKKMDGTRDLDALLLEAQKIGFALDRSMMEKFVRGLACYNLLEDEPVIDRATTQEQRLDALDRELDELRVSMKSPSVPPPSEPEAASFENMSEEAPAADEPSQVASGFVSFQSAPEGPVARRFDAMERKLVRFLSPRLPRAAEWIKRNPSSFRAGTVTLGLALLVGVLFGVTRTRTEPPPVTAKIHSVTVDSGATVTEVPVTPGKRVAAGDVLAVLEADGWKDLPDIAPVSKKLDDATERVQRLTVLHAQALTGLESAVEQAKRNLAAAEKAQSKAKSKSAKKSAAKKVTALKKLVLSKQAKVSAARKSQSAALAKTVAQVESEKVALETARQQYALRELRAPSAGVLITDLPAVGQHVEAEQALFMISEGGPSATAAR